MKRKFNEGIGKVKRQNATTLDYNQFLKVFDHTKKEGHEVGSSLLKVFGPTVCRKAFLLFNRNMEGEIDFRNFCCALSIICLGSTNEKFRFIFDLFDINCDGLLSRKELLQMLNTLSQLLLEKKENSGRLRVEWVDLQSS